MADSGGLQLLPQTRKKIELHIPGQNKMLVLSLVVIFFVLAVYAGSYAYRQSLFAQAQTIDDQLASLEKQRDKEKEKRFIDFQKQLNVVGPLLAAHVNWSEALGKIQRLMEPKVQVNSLHAEVLKQVVSIEGFADSYSTVAKQVAALYNEPAITDIVLNKISSISTGKIKFDMVLKFNTERFLFKQKTASLPR